MAYNSLNSKSDSSSQLTLLNIPNEGGISIPEFRGPMSLRAIQGFETMWKKYLSRVEEYNNGQTPAKKIKPKVLTSVVDDDTLIVIAELYLGCDPEEVDDAGILRAFEAVKEKYSSDNFRNLDEVFKGFSMDMKIKDPIGRVSDYAIRFTKLVRTNLLDEDVKDEESFKHIVKDYLLKGIRPENLTIRVEQLVKRDKKILSSKVLFFRNLEEQAIQENQAFEVSKVASRNADKNRVPKEDWNKSKRKSFERGKIGGIEDNKFIPAKRHVGGKESGGENPKRLGCLKCGSKEHLLKSCPKASPEDRKKLWDEYHQSGKRMKRIALDLDGDLSEEDDQVDKIATISSSIDVFLDEKVKVKAVLDSGCSVSILPMAFIDQLKEESRCKLRKLDFGIELSLAVQTANTVRADWKINLDICLITGLGTRVSVRGVECLVVKETMDEMLLGEDLMLKLGIHPRQTLEDLVSGRGEGAKEGDSLSHGYVKEDLEEDAQVFIEKQRLRQVKLASSDLRAALLNLVEKAEQNGFKEGLSRELLDLCVEHEDLFRIELGADPPASVAPLRMHLKEDARPYRAKPRRYPEEYRKFLSEFVEELENLGYIRRNASSRWAAPVMVVQKPGGRGLRVVVDLRGLNSQIEPNAWPMPMLDVVMHHVKGSQCFALLDAFKGYWQFPVEPESQELLSFMTDKGVYTPTRIIQGCTDGVHCFQAGMTEALADLIYMCVLLWVDDVLVYSKDQRDHLKNLREVFEKLQERGIKLNVLRCELFTPKVKWCGRILDGEGFLFDPEYVQGITKLRLPDTLADLQQFLSAMNWVRSSIPEYSSLVAPLQDFLLEGTKSVGSLKKSALKGSVLKNIGWKEAHSDCFEKCKQRLVNQVKLHYLKEEYITCVFTDASDTHWGVVITQIPPEDVNLELMNQRHEPLFFCSGGFRDAQLRWSVIEKETWPILMAIDRARHILMCSKGFRLFTDHKNLVYVLSTKIRDSEHRKHIADKMERWSLRLRAFRYTVEHIDGERNDWADLLSRWGAAPPSVRTRRLSVVPPRTSSQLHRDGFRWPSLSEVIECQAGKTPEESLGCVVSDGVWKKGDRFWVSSKDLQVRIMLIAHAGLGGHRGVQHTFSSIEEMFIWDQMKQQVRDFVRKCLHCFVGKDAVVPRVWGHAMHGSRPNEVLHFDFMKIHQDTPIKYLLVIKDGFSGYCELVPCVTSDHMVVAEALLDWVKRFGVPTSFVSDQGAHFKNKFIAELTRLLCVQHHFTIAYTPWSNGTVERLNRDIKRILRVLLSDFRMSFTEWSRVVPLVQYVLNQSLSETLGNRAPVTVFTGLLPTGSLKVVFRSSPSLFSSAKSTPEEIIRHVLSLRKSLDDLHAEVSRKKAQKMEQNKKAQKKIVPVNFDIGDYVLFSQGLRTPAGKLSPTWTGPYRIVAVLSEWVYHIEHLLSNKVLEAHSRKLRFYDDRMLDITEDIRDFVQDSTMTFEIKSICDIRKGEEGEEVFVHWLGFEEHERTWEPIDSIREAAPKLLAEFLSNRN